MATPEERARDEIDALLAAAGWVVQDRDRCEPRRGARRGRARVPAEDGRGGLPALRGPQGGRGRRGEAGRGCRSPASRRSRRSTATACRSRRSRRGASRCRSSTRAPASRRVFTNGLDPEPRSRRVFAFHQPETLLAGSSEPTTPARPRCARCRRWITEGLWPAQVEAIRNLEQSLAEDRPRALIQMATGSGKTFTAVNVVYRLIKHADARRVLFLVDRATWAGRR